MVPIIDWCKPSSNDGDAAFGTYALALSVITATLANEAALPPRSLPFHFEPAARCGVVRMLFRTIVAPVGTITWMHESSFAPPTRDAAISRLLHRL